VLARAASKSRFSEASLAISLGRFQILREPGDALAHFVVRQRLRPTVVARQVVAVPLGADAMNLADQPAANRVHGVVVQNAVVPLMSRGQDLAQLLGEAGHLLAFVNAVAHQFFGQHVLAGFHGFDGHRSVQVQRQRDHDALDLRVLEQIVIVLVVDFDVLAGFVLGLPAIFFHQATADLEGVFAGMIAVEGAVDVVGPDIGDRDHLDVAGRDGSQQHVAFVAGADHSHAQRVGHRGFVAEIRGAQSRARHGAGGDAGFEEIAPRDADCVLEIPLADGLFFRT
jgi:hypothetical protein